MFGASRREQLEQNLLALELLLRLGAAIVGRIQRVIGAA
jgi:aryl-alcohol dehydrogenase-like predicted oxidoreductase